MRHSDSAIVHTVAQLKGRRLRMARALTGFSRQELFEKIGIATSTIDTWESGRVELSQKSAERVCSALKKVGVACSIEWLLTGGGTPPRLMDTLEKTMTELGSFRYPDFSTNSNSTSFYKLKKLPSLMDESIKRELSFFLTIHPGSIFHIVEKDFSNARFKRGDCVAGIEENVQSLIGKNVIAVLVDSSVILCRILNCSEDGFSNVYINSDEQNKKVQIISAAEIIWHRMLKRFH
ncbi:MAG: helix-turn-helix transcriptional regulator [Alphaproteobacteria bacterium]|nr:helix-turn-helix transcriptional regulator [Alphaproteobacteria bacterium]